MKPPGDKHAIPPGEAEKNLNDYPEVEPKKIKTGRPSKYEPRFCEMIVGAMGEGYSATAFAGMIGVCRATIDEWAQNHVSFSEALRTGKAKRLLHWEKAALNGVANGTSGGSSTLIAFGLRNMGGDEWQAAEKTETKITGELSISKIVREVVDHKSA